jgi:hypothetical protein
VPPDGAGEDDEVGEAWNAWSGMAGVGPVRLACAPRGGAGSFVGGRCSYPAAAQAHLSRDADSQRPDGPKERETKNFATKDLSYFYTAFNVFTVQ